MRRKISWDMVYKEFVSRYPHSRKDLVRWHPYGFLQIRLYFKDGTGGVYDYFAKKIKTLADF